MQTVSIVMAAGKGSRMKDYDGNKTLLPLIPGDSPFCGERPFLVHILETLPEGPKALIVHHRESDVKAATARFSPVYCRQPTLNGTGGALLAAQDFIEGRTEDRVLITMGDVPFVHPETYRNLLAALDRYPMVALGFQPRDRKQYGVLEIDGDRVAKITEWKFWKDYPAEAQARLTVCNAGIYAARRETLVNYLPVLASRPQVVLKARDGRMVEIEEFFLTDLVEYLTADGLSVGWVSAADERETMGIDDPEALNSAQTHYRRHYL